MRPARPFFESHVARKSLLVCDPLFRSYQFSGKILIQVTRRQGISDLFQPLKKETLLYSIDSSFEKKRRC